MTYYEELAKHIQSNAKIEKYHITNDMLFLYSSSEEVVNNIFFLKNDNLSCCRTLIEVFAVDYPARRNRFEIIYSLLSMKQNHRIWIKTEIEPNDEIHSISTIFLAANWFEREIFDMFGIKFIDHPNLKRIFLEDDFDGHPLKKDFPLSGYHEVGYSEIKKNVIKKPVYLDPNYRNMHKLSPWEEKNELHE